MIKKKHIYIYIYIYIYSGYEIALIEKVSGVLVVTLLEIL